MADFVKNNKRNNRKTNNPKVSNKVKEFGNKREEGITPPDVCAGIIEYKMSKVMADDILKESKGKRPTQEVLCEYVNTQCGLKGYCVKVFVDIE